MDTSWRIWWGYYNRQVLGHLIKHVEGSEESQTGLKAILEGLLNCVILPWTSPESKKDCWFSRLTNLQFFVKLPDHGHGICMYMYIYISCPIYIYIYIHVCVPMYNIHIFPTVYVVLLMFNTHIFRTIKHWDGFTAKLEGIFSFM